MRLLRALLCAALFATAVTVAAAATATAAPAACQSGKRPVILLHGTFKKSGSTWDVLAPELTRGGWCAYALDYGNGGLNPVTQSARELAAYVDQVLAATGASKVDIVGYSQGGMMPRHYLKFLGGSAKVNALIGIAPSNHGTTQPLAKLLGATFCPACDDQSAGSAFMRALNDGGDLAGSVKYTTIATRYEAVVTPYRGQALSGSASRVTNVVLQDACPLHFTEHLLIPHSRPAVKWVVNALERGGVADPGYRPPC
ncbi:esterase/lipase family protein [Allokutzneria albata]|uniref:Lipase (Class 2) n=1 Tax=Allokutzneria albata TaxID=211114 RepID=A0A1H0C646_ALLAB|nr:alpha/beta fold hydrolase [Allokutzneria albata]SDN53307.1 Lipase (class 2) [Allokutzneria albata]